MRAAFEGRAGRAYSSYLPTPPSRWLTLAVGGGLVLAELVIAVAVVRPEGKLLLAALAGVVGLALVFAFPFAATCVFIALVASVLYDTFFSIDVGLSLTAPQLVLGALLLVAVVRPRRRTWGGAAGAALATFLGFVFLGMAVALSSGRIDTTTARDLIVPFADFLLFYVIVRLFPEPARMRRLLAVCVGLAAATGVVGLLVALSGSTHSFLQPPGQGAILDEEAGGLLRVRLPGISLAYGLFGFALVSLVTAGRRRVLWGAGLAGMIVALLVSQTRNMWIGTVLALALLIVLGGGLTRRRILAGVVIAVTAVGVLVLAGPQAAGPTSELKPVLERGETLLSPNQGLQEQSLRDRGSETTAAWHSLNGHWLTGLGVGASFGVTFDEDLGGGRFERVDQTFLHNQYLYLIVIGGIGALLSFLTFLGVVLARLWQARVRDPAMAGLLVGLLSVMLSAFVMIAFVDPHFMVLLSIISAAAFTLGGRSARRDPSAVA
jgi:O-antigen ligase